MAKNIFVEHNILMKVFGVGLFSVIISIVFTPGVLKLIEYQFNTVVSFEQVMRVFFGLLTILFVLFLLSLKNISKPRWLVLAILLFVAATLFVFIFDGSHNLRTEYNWIRYFTAFALLVAGSSIIIGANISDIFKKKWPWFLLGSFFIFAAFDELFEVHELLGRIIETQWNVPHVFTDFITLLYAAVGVGVVFIFNGTKKLLCLIPKTALKIFTAAVIIFFVVMIFDTVDVIFESIIKNIFVIVGSNDKFIFSDFWIILHDPTELFNFIEEIFEYLAALLFMVFGLVFFFSNFWQQNTKSPKYFRIIYVSFLVEIILCGFILIYLFPPTTSTPIATNTWQVERVLGPEDGTRHSDDVEWHKNWGAVVANEWGPNIIQAKDSGEIIVMRDSLFLDLDSIAVSDDLLWVSDGKRHAIYKHTKKDGWKIFYEDHLVIPEPEALFVTDDFVYVVDESIAAVFTINKDTLETVQLEFPDEVLIGPEGIVVTGDNNVLITDDITGKIWQYKDAQYSEWGSGNHLEPEAIHESIDGSIWVSDNRSRTITHYTASGEIIEEIKFAFNYEDIQGITTDNNGNVFVVTSDGYGGGAAMPSYVWKLSKVN